MRPIFKGHDLKVTDYPALFRSAEKTSRQAQQSHFIGICAYLFCVVGSAFSAECAQTTYLASNAAIVEWADVFALLLFLVGLIILIYFQLKRHEEYWYNGRAVAESVKTRTWRWMMRANPYHESTGVAALFTEDLREILKQNRSLASVLGAEPSGEYRFTEKMQSVRDKSLADRVSFYLEARVQNQITRYGAQAAKNTCYERLFFGLSVILHFVVIVLILIRLKGSEWIIPLNTLIALAGCVLTWGQSRKYGELKAAYSQATHEIGLLKADVSELNTEEKFSKYVIDSEAAFSREHTQWVARKG